LQPNPNLIPWLDQHPAEPGRRALKVGCGYGDDAEELCRRDYDVVAFDVAPTAVATCQKRFPDSKANYVVADLLDPPAKWKRAFDFVLESYTLQVLPPAQRAAALSNVAEFVAPGGTLLVIARGREPDEDRGLMPWPLTRAELLQFESHGLTIVEFEDILDNESPPVRRFRVTLRR